MKLYNTLTREVEDLKPINDNIVGIYSCGPTVYDALTIGNWTAYVRWDILARTLRSCGYRVNWYMNITDVGHLVSDADTGEDKLEKSAKREGTSAWEIAKKYTDDFITGLDELSISIDKSHLVKATDHIEDQIDLIKTLETRGCTYIIDDGVYFDSSTFSDYGKMAKLDLAGLRSGARVDIGDKRHPTDFALWKFSPQSEKRDMEWKSPWGKGFPGWHIECSAMAMKYLGPTLDIHTGGIDHIPVHHTNEIAQSESATGRKFVNVWIHSNFLQVDSQKISKSLGNGFTLQDLNKRGYSSKDFKLFVLQSIYQSESNFTWEGMESAQIRRKDIQAMMDLRFQVDTSGKDYTSNIAESIKEINNHLQVNLNTPLVLSELSRLASEMTQPIVPKSKESLDSFISELDDLLGLDFGTSTDISIDQKELIKRRKQARLSKNWRQADELRSILQEQNISVNDIDNGSVWRRT